MQNLDATVLGTALPAIARAFGLSPVRLHLTMTAYLLSLAVCMPLSGWIADKYGARNVFRLAAFVFTAASGAGALLMKFAVQRVLLRFGFRSALTWNALLSGVSITVCALFTQATPALVIFAVLLASGFFRSLQFTAINTIAYADLDQSQMSRAIGFTSMAQQLALSLGVGLGALMLDLSGAWHGTQTPGRSEFALALLTIAGGVALSALLFARLPGDAGNEVARREPTPRC